MRIKGTKFGQIALIALIAIGGLVACNTDTDTKTPPVTSSDSSTGTATVSDSTARDSVAMAAAKTAKKKRKASIMMPAAGTDKIMKDKDGVYNRAETMPEFPGGQDGIANYLNDHIDYSMNQGGDTDTGRLVISFVVDENGKVMNAHLMGNKKIGNGVDDQAVKAINNMPSWKPGQVKGKNVKTRLELPISFESAS